MSSISGTLSNKSGEYKDRKDFVRSVSPSGDYAYDVWKEGVSENTNKEQYGSTMLVDDLPF